MAEKAIADQVAQPLKLSMIEAAEGISEVVSTSIAEGIRLMSVQRGVDPRKFTMLAFGGAAGLQAGKVARQLQMERVIIPAAAAVLSAHGMLSTDLKYDYSRSYPASLSGIDLDSVRSIVAGMESEGRDKLLGQGVPETGIEISVSADMRYLDQIYEVNVPLPDLAQGAEILLAQWAANFHQRYQELYSYSQSEQEIRLVTLRATAVGRLPKMDPPPLDNKDAGNQTPVKEQGRRSVYLKGWTEAPVYDIGKLSPGDSVSGPAILQSDFTTVLVEPGDSAEVDRYGGIELRISLEKPDTEPGQGTAADHPDPVTLQTG